MTLLNLCLPMYNLIFAFGSMIGLGAATRYAILQAQGEARAQRYFSNAILCACLIAIPFMLAGAFCPGTLLQLMGGDGDIVALGLNYTRIFLLFTPFFMCNYILSAFVRNDGDPSLAMVATLSGSLFNVVFDYIFMFPMGLGLAGAALATAVSPIISIAICSRHFFKKENTLQFVRQMPSVRLLGQSCQLGISGFVGELSSGVTTTVFNFLLLGLAGNVGVAAYGVVANFALVATAIFNGVAQGAQPLVSRCYGQNDHAGARKLLLLGSGTVLVLAAVLYAAVFGLTDPFVSWFNSENSVQMAQYAHTGMRMYFVGYFFAGFNIMAAGYLSAVNRPVEASVTSICRGMVAIVVCSLVLSAVFGMPGVWAAFPASELLTALLTLLFAAQKKGRDGLNIHLLFPHGLLGRKPGLCGATGQCPPLCRGLAGFFFEDPAQVVGPGKTAQAGHHVQRILPVQQQPLCGFDAHGGQVLARRHAHGGGKGAHQMAFGDAQPFAELLHAVQPGVIGADVLNSGLHQRGQGWRGAVGIRQFAQQGKDQLAAGTAVGGLSSARRPSARRRQDRSRPWQGRQLPQAVQKLHAGLPGQLDAQQVAAVLRGQGERGAA